MYSLPSPIPPSAINYTFPIYLISCLIISLFHIFIYWSAKSQFGHPAILVYIPVQYCDRYILRERSKT